MNADTSDVTFMRNLEAEYKRLSGLEHRSHYKIFYCQVRPAPILTLGINPGGSPATISPDGTMQDGDIRASASPSYFESNEHDVLDCEWRENTGLRQLLYPFVGGSPERFRAEIIKTNLAFRRSARKTDIDIESAIEETSPFLNRIIERVAPRIVLLTGVPILSFVERFASQHCILEPVERDPGVKQVVFAAAKATLRATKTAVTVVQVAHASQFAWTYERYNVARRALAYAEA